MKFKNNRFAIFPHQCSDCKQYVWIEPYRKGEVWKHNRWIKIRLCKDCVKNYLPKMRKKEVV